jgi:hypothetical protein
MQTFSNLQQALQYQIKCPLCAQFLSIQTDNDGIYGQNVIQFNLTENVDSQTDDILTIDKITNKIKIDYYDTRDKEMTQDNIMMSNRFMRPYGGEMYESISVKCNYFYHYKYIIKIQANLTTLKITDISLNSESIDVSDRFDNLFTIENNYSSNRTIFRRYNCKDDLNWTDTFLPLVPLDLNDPILTVERLQQLTTFI